MRGFDPLLISAWDHAQLAAGSSKFDIRSQDFSIVRWVFSVALKSCRLPAAIRMPASGKVEKIEYQQVEKFCQARTQVP
jgi:hypothetical protein